MHSIPMQMASTSLQWLAPKNLSQSSERLLRLSQTIHVHAAQEQRQRNVAPKPKLCAIISSRSCKSHIISRACPYLRRHIIEVIASFDIINDLKFSRHTRVDNYSATAMISCAHVIRAICRLQLPMIRSLVPNTRFPICSIIA